MDGKTKMKEKNKNKIMENVLILTMSFPISWVIFLITLMIVFPLGVNVFIYYEFILLYSYLAGLFTTISTFRHYKAKLIEKVKNNEI